MIKKSIKIPALILCLCVLLTSCSNPTIFRTVDSLLTPPLYNSQYEGLVDAFNADVGTGITFSNPSSGDHLSAITVTDLDGDSREEAVILYRDNLEDNVVHLSVYDYFSDSWKVCSEFRGYGDRVDSIVFEDFDSDGFSEIMINWSYSGINSGSAFSVYSTRSMNMNYTETLIQACDIAIPVDMDADGIKEILYVAPQNDGAAITRSACLLGMEDSAFRQMGSTAVDPNVTGYVSYRAEKYDSDSPMKVYLDAPKGNNMMITEVLYWDSELKKLAAPLFDEETGSNTATLRYQLINCADINNDGRIEIPVQKVYENNDTGGGPEFYLTDWTYFDGNTPTYYVKTFVNAEESYFINLAVLKYRGLYVRTLESSSRRNWIVCTASNSIGGRVLFTVTCVPSEKYKAESFPDYVTLFRSPDSVILVRLNTDDIDEEEIRKIVMKIPT